MIDILYSSVCSQLIILPDNMNEESTSHELEEHYKLIVDPTFIATQQPEDSEQRKAHYHAKSPTNYAFKIQIT